MPGADGYAVAHRARSLPGLGGTLLIAVTGYMGAGHRQRATAAGSDFFVVKPMDPNTLEALLMSRQVALSAPGPATVRPADYRILVVDDDDGVLRSLAAGLPREGFDVCLAASGQEAADLLRACRPGIDVVLMDVRMPGIDGIEATRQIVGAAPSTVVFLCSTYQLADLPSDAKTSGARAYINKEAFSPDLLARMWSDHAGAVGFIA
jgi:CheY-like chemotaxis protein